MIRTPLLVALLLSLSLCVQGLGEFAGYKVVRALLVSQEQVDVVNAWELDVWSRESVLAMGLNDIRVHGEHLEQLEKMGVQYDVLIDDVEQHLQLADQELHTSRASKAAMDDFFIAYHTYPEIVAFLQDLTATYPNIAKFVTLPRKSIQGNNIVGVVISGSTSPKKRLFFSGGQHAREWVSPATSLYIINQLLTLYSVDPTVKSLVDSTEIHFFPLVNPDGYLWTWTGTANRLWRKNRRANTGGSYGVDLNRNWNDHWGGGGSSGTPTSDTYRGTAPFSEPETLALSEYIQGNPAFNGAIDYHSYSQLILRPYGWTDAPPPNDATAKLVGDTIGAEIFAVNNVAYTSQPSWQLYYTSGSAQDWYYSQAKIPLSYTIELRDTGTYGFQLPPAQIKPTGAENWAGFVYFVQAVLQY